MRPGSGVEREMPAETRAFFVHPGQLAASATPRYYTTILGTCVSVCLFDPEAGVGGLNHYLLPYGTELTGTRYGNVAMARLLRQVLDQGAHREHLRAKVFGGMTSSQPMALHQDLGGSNVALALEWLSATGIPVLARDVGGHRGRKLLFHSQDGAAWVKHL